MVLVTAYGGVPKCDTVYEEKCWDEPRQQCSSVQKPFTTTAYEQECHTEYDQQCNTVYDTKVSNRVNLVYFFWEGLIVLNALIVMEINYYFL